MFSQLGRRTVIYLFWKFCLLAQHTGNMPPFVLMGRYIFLEIDFSIIFYEHSVSNCQLNIKFAAKKKFLKYPILLNKFCYPKLIMKIFIGNLNI